MTQITVDQVYDTMTTIITINNNNLLLLLSSSSSSGYYCLTYTKMHTKNCVLRFIQQ